jgi:hypothetical protein
MTAHLLRECGQKPSYYVGAEIPILLAYFQFTAHA